MEAAASSNPWDQQGGGNDPLELGGEEGHSNPIDECLLMLTRSTR